MSNHCTHLDQIRAVKASGPGCVECLAKKGSRWLHLRRCAVCGHIGCCDSSPNKHASEHARVSGHPIIQSYEPEEDWLWCYVDELTFEISSMSPSPSHPPGWSPGPPEKK